MDLARLTRAREIITGRSHKREGSGSRVALAAGELAGQLRAATAKAQILQAATQGDPRDVQSRHTP